MLSGFLRRLQVTACRKSNRLRRIAEPVSAALQRVRLPPLTAKKKSTLNCYFVTSVDICLAAFCVGCKLLHAAKAPDFRRRAAPRAKALWLRYPPLYTKKQTPHLRRLFFGGQRWIRTTEDRVGRFTVCSLWPLGNLPVFI